MKKILAYTLLFFSLNICVLHSNVITAENFAKEYIENRKVADSKFLNKKVDIIGTVNKVGKTILFQTYIEINAYKDDYDEFFIYAYPISHYNKKIKKLKKGTKIRIIGKCEGKSFSGNFKIVNCRVYTHKK